MYTKSGGQTTVNIVGSSTPSSARYAKQFYCAVLKRKGIAFPEGECSDSPQWPAQCVMQGCNKAAVHGGHVKTSRHSTDWYIVPTCQAPHNRPHKPDRFDVEGNVPMVRETRVSAEDRERIGEAEGSYSRGPLSTSDPSRSVHSGTVVDRRR